MSQFIAIHYNGQRPTFTYTNSLAEAKSHLAGLIRSGHVTPSDALVIVRAEDEEILYFKLANNTLADLAIRKSVGVSLVRPLLRLLIRPFGWLARNLAIHHR
ncbi:hypothetical protein BN8_05195 [Fibrisoma limi BUZ 3]|uniref:Uncharacterized protein n=1 Tax=Fibrisoma limi BUZ 3 TaxID=1185876 RepID=I2GPR9_9BACT|nr:hypothetical protein [Fibrisoma limi]CCH55897.1 hypothetical protein BN8_05195 [Fibrisoma limi BUZ 3]